MPEADPLADFFAERPAVTGRRDAEGFTPPRSHHAEARTADPLELEAFLGAWRDSLGNNVHVEWSRPGSRGGQLDVQLRKPRSDRDPIRLNIKRLSLGKFSCGHYELDDCNSNPSRIIWVDCKNRAKTSTWERDPLNPGQGRAETSDIDRRGWRDDQWRDDRYWDEKWRDERGRDDKWRGDKWRDSRSRERSRGGRRRRREASLSRDRDREASRPREVGVVGAGVGLPGGGPPLGGTWPSATPQVPAPVPGTGPCAPPGSFEAANAGFVPEFDCKLGPGSAWSGEAGAPKHVGQGPPPSSGRPGEAAFVGQPESPAPGLALPAPETGEVPPGVWSGGPTPGAWVPPSEPPPTGPPAVVNGTPTGAHTSPPNIGGPPLSMHGPPPGMHGPPPGAHGLYDTGPRPGLVPQQTPARPPPWQTPPWQAQQPLWHHQPPLPAWGPPSGPPPARHPPPPLG